MGGKKGFEGATMISRAVDECIVSVHGPAVPTDGEWDKAMALLESVGPARARSLIWTEGGAPNATQRAKLAKVTGSARSPMAVLTASGLARAAGTAMSWFNPAFRMFAPEELDAALDHLTIAPARRGPVLAALEEMKVSLRITPRDRG